MEKFVTAEFDAAASKTPRSALCSFLVTGAVWSKNGRSRPSWPLVTGFKGREQ